MKNNETGEFELVLGHRQLLSGFFVVVILFAVFFVMGYIVGRNTSGPVRGGDQASVTLPAAADTRPAPATGAAVQQTPPPTAQPAAQPAAAQPETAQPVAPPPASQSATQPETKPVDTAATPPEAAPAEPASGPYLQVVSVAQHDAEVVARTLKDKGFPASTSPGPNGRTRVLVGPYDDIAALGKAKADLENLGFHPIVKK